MSVWSRLRLRRGRHARGASDGPRMAVDEGAVRGYLTGWTQTHRGVEAYVEPPTTVTATTMVLIAFDGEWTRRAVPSRDAAFEFAHSLDIPVYDVLQTGYPSRMREWNSRQRRRRS